MAPALARRPVGLLRLAPIVSAISDVPGLLASCPVTSSSLFELAFLLGLSRLQSRTLT